MKSGMEIRVGLCRSRVVGESLSRSTLFVTMMLTVSFVKRLPALFRAVNGLTTFPSSGVEVAFLGFLQRLLLTRRRRRQLLSFLHLASFVHPAWAVPIRIGC